MAQSTVRSRPADPSTSHVRLNVLAVPRRETRAIPPPPEPERMAVWEAVLRPGEVLYIPPWWLHRAEAVNESVSVSSWFEDTLTASVLKRSAALPLLPMLTSLPSAVRDDAFAAAGPEAAETEAASALRLTVAVVRHYLAAIGGEGIFTHVVQQRYAHVYGTAEDGSEMRWWRELCSAEARAVAMGRFGNAALSEVEAIVASKLEVFGELEESAAMEAAEARAVSRHDIAGIRVAFFSRWQRSLLTGEARDGAGRGGAHCRCAGHSLCVYIYLAVI